MIVYVDCVCDDYGILFDCCVNCFNAMDSASSAATELMKSSTITHLQFPLC